MAFYQGQKAMSEINVVPLVDVMLVLLIIFIITAPLLTHSVKIDLPKASSSPDTTQPEHIEFAIRADCSFFWDGEAEKAELLRMSKNEFVRFKWVEDEDDNTYFELRIKIDGITKDVALVVTDFADDQEEVEENTLLWESQINDLKRVIGA